MIAFKNGIELFQCHSLVVLRSLSGFNPDLFFVAIQESWNALLPIK